MSSALSENAASDSAEDQDWKSNLSTWFLDEVDALPVRIFECFFTLSFLCWMGYCFFAWEEWLTSAGFHLTESDLLRMGYPTPWPLLENWQVPLFFCTILLGALLVFLPVGNRGNITKLLGDSWARRAGFVILFGCAIYAQRIDFMMTFAGNKIFVAVFAILMFSPAMVRCTKGGGLIQSAAPLRLFQAALILDYFASGLAKMDGDWLTSSDVLWSTVQGIHRTDFSAFALRYLPRWSWTLMQHTSLAFEVLAPLLFCLRFLRPYALFFGFCFHLGIALLMHDLIFFSLIMWSFYPLFMNPESLSLWIQKVSRSWNGSTP